MIYVQHHFDGLQYLLICHIIGRYINDLKPNSTAFQMKGMSFRRLINNKWLNLRKKYFKRQRYFKNN